MGPGTAGARSTRPARRPATGAGRATVAGTAHRLSTFRVADLHQRRRGLHANTRKLPADATARVGPGFDRAAADSAAATDHRAPRLAPAGAGARTDCAVATGPALATRRSGAGGTGAAGGAD